MSEAGAPRRTVPSEPTVFSQPSELVNRVSRLFHAPIERVFHHFTDPTFLPYLFSADPAQVVVEKLEFRPGGHYVIVVHRPNGPPMRFSGVYQEIVPPRRVVNTFEVSLQPGVVAVETDEFESVGASTRLTVSWKYPRQADRDMMYGPEMKTEVTAMWDHMEDLLSANEPVASRAWARA